jgi:hypothetical protein
MTATLSVLVRMRSWWSCAVLCVVASACYVPAAMQCCCCCRGHDANQHRHIENTYVAPLLGSLQHHHASAEAADTSNKYGAPLS